MGIGGFVPGISMEVSHVFRQLKGDIFAIYLQISKGSKKKKINKKKNERLATTIDWGGSDSDSCEQGGQLIFIMSEPKS